MSALISIDKLSKNFGALEAVSGVSFSVKKGEILGFLGPNGAGKTTTMRMITGYLPPSSGKVSVCGVDVIANALEAQRRIGYLPEGGPLYSDMTPASFLDFIAKVRSLGIVKRNDRIAYVVEKLHLSEVMHQNIETLSKGYKRRVAFAQAILHDPEVLILDEPTDGLDPNQKHEVSQLIKDMAKDKAIIISTHILEEVEAICSKAIIIANGKIVASGTPNDLVCKSPEHNAVIVRLRGASTGKILNDILQVKGVSKVNVESNNTIIALSKNGKSILTDVVDAIRKKKVIVEEIYEKSGGLDDAFRALTSPYRLKKKNNTLKNKGK